MKRSLLFMGATSLLLLGSCQLNTGVQEEDKNFSPGQSRSLSNVETLQIKTFCTSLSQYRKVVKSSQLNADVNLKIVSNSCSDTSLSTNNYDAVYDQTVEGTLYYQSADDLCQERIWTDEVEPVKEYCEYINGGQSEDRITKDLSLYVFAAASDATNGTTVTIKEFAIDSTDSSKYTFQRSHSLSVYTKSVNGDYGKVMSYTMEERCSNSDNTRYCQQSEN